MSFAFLHTGFQTCGPSIQSYLGPQKNHCVCACLCKHWAEDPVPVQIKASCGAGLPVYIVCTPTPFQSKLSRSASPHVLKFWRRKMPICKLLTHPALYRWHQISICQQWVFWDHTWAQNLSWTLLLWLEQQHKLCFISYCHLALPVSHRQDMITTRMAACKNTTHEQQLSVRL